MKKLLIIPVAFLLFASCKKNPQSCYACVSTTYSRVGADDLPTRIDSANICDKSADDISLYEVSKTRQYFSKDTMFQIKTKCFKK